jgi:hypothetical protein
LDGLYVTNLAVHGLNGSRVYTMSDGTIQASAMFTISAGTLYFQHPPSGSWPDCTIPVSVTRAGNTWTISADSSSVAALYQTVRGKEVRSYWYMPFSITVTLP